MVDAPTPVDWLVFNTKKAPCFDRRRKEAKGGKVARLPQPEFALGLLVRTIRPSLSFNVKGDRGFVLDFFDRACDE